MELMWRNPYKLVLSEAKANTKNHYLYDYVFGDIVCKSWSRSKRTSVFNHYSDYRHHQNGNGELDRILVGSRFSILRFGYDWRKMLIVLTLVLFGWIGHLQQQVCGFTTCPTHILLPLHRTNPNVPPNKGLIGNRNYELLLSSSMNRQHVHPPTPKRRSSLWADATSNITLTDSFEQKEEDEELEAVSAEMLWEQKLQDELARRDGAEESMKFHLARTIQRQLEENTRRNEELRTEIEMNVQRETEERITSALEERWKQPADEKDGEILSLLQSNDQKETEINRLKFQLNEYRLSMEEEEKRVIESEQRIRDLTQQFETERLAEKTVLDRWKDQFRQEKDTLKTSVRTLSEEFQAFTNQSIFEINQWKSRYEAESKKFNQSNVELQQIQADILQMKQNHKMDLTRLQLEATKRLQAFQTVSGQEKRDLQKISWDLENKLEKAKYDLIVAKKDYMLWKDKASTLENQLITLEAALTQQLIELQERLEADRMFYARSKMENRIRMTSFVQKMNLRMDRRKKKAEKVLDETKEEWRRIVESVQETMKKEKDDALLAKSEEMALKEEEAKRTILAMQDDTDRTISELRARIESVKQEGITTLASLRAKMADDLATSKKQFELEQQILVRDFDEKMSLAIESVRLEAEREKMELQIDAEQRFARTMDAFRSQSEKEKYDLKLDLTQQVMRSKLELSNLETVVEEKNELITQYEEERRSAKTLLRLCWKAVKQSLKNRSVKIFRAKTRPQKQEE